MTQEEKKLLLKDTCARSSYGTIYNDIHGDSIVTYIDLEEGVVYLPDFDECRSIEDVKPYLRPMSSMTEDEVKQYYKIRTGEDRYKSLGELDAELFDFYHKNHIDYRGLIPMGLALEAPKGMYKV